MKTSAILVVLLAGLTSGLGANFDIRNETEFKKLLPAEAQLKQIGTNFGFVEGPVWLKQDGGMLIFSDIPNNALKKWTESGGIINFRKPSHNSNGNTVDRQGHLITCEHTGRRVAIRDDEGKLKTLVSDYRGKKLNSPNDVVVKSDGTVWFTDPPYGIKPEEKEQDANYLFRFDPKSGQLAAMARDFYMPNGLCFSPDESKLYVADSGKPHHIRTFTFSRRDGFKPTGVFCVIDNGVPDGIRCDAAGRIWVAAGDGVQIFAPTGELIGKILMTETPANLCFGGADGQTLFITARTSLYAINVSTRSAIR